MNEQAITDIVHNILASNAHTAACKAALLKEYPHFPAMYEDYARIAELKGTSILVVAEDDSDGRNLTAFLKERHFPNVDYVIPPEDPTQQLPGDMVIFHREDKVKDQDRRYVTDSYVTEYVLEHSDSQMIIYFGPKNDYLNVKAGSIGFANSKGTLPDNILRKLLLAAE